MFLSCINVFLYEQMKMPTSFSAYLRTKLLVVFLSLQRGIKHVICLNSLSFQNLSLKNI